MQCRSAPHGYGDPRRCFCVTSDICLSHTSYLSREQRGLGRRVHLGFRYRTSKTTLGLHALYRDRETTSRLGSCYRKEDKNHTHSIIIIRLQKKVTRHHPLNGLVARAFTFAGIPSSKEPHGLVQSDGKRPDGLTPVAWKGGKPLA